VTFEALPEPEPSPPPQPPAQTEPPAETPDTGAPSELSDLADAVDGGFAADVFDSEPPPPLPQARKHLLLGRIARACRISSVVGLLIALLGVAPIWIQVQNRLDSSLAGGLAMLALVGGLGVLAVLLFAMGESLALLIQIEENTRRTCELLQERED